MNEVAQYLRDEIALCEKAKKLGLHRLISHETAVLAFQRAVQEIERLEELRSRMSAPPDRNLGCDNGNAP